LDRRGLNFYAINLKFLQIVDKYMAYSLWKFHIDNLKTVISRNFFILQKYFRFLDRLGLNFYAINLKFLQIVDKYVAYTLWKFHIDSLKTVISRNFFILHKYFRILDRLGLNFYAINLKFSQTVDNYMAYTLWKFHIDSLKTVISRNFFISENIFAFCGGSCGGSYGGKEWTLLNINFQIFYIKSSI